QSPLLLATQAAVSCWFSFSSSPVLAAIPQFGERRDLGLAKKR
ncbi:hypothetical protein HZ326_31869, partial [Fusarium oxysporum f. sp. albedinis]